MYYPDPLGKFNVKCESEEHLIINARGVVYEFASDATTTADSLNSWFPELRYKICNQYLYNDMRPQTSSWSSISIVIGLGSFLKELEGRWTKQA